MADSCVDIVRYLTYLGCMGTRTLGLVSATILQAVLEGGRYGLDIMDVTGLPDGTVYKTLHRMEKRGLIQSQWEEPGIAERERRPRRKYYAITPEGEIELARVAERFLVFSRGGVDPTPAPAE